MLGEAGRWGAAWGREARAGGQVCLMLFLLGGRVESTPGLIALSLPPHGSPEKIVHSCLLPGLRPPNLK